MSDLQWVGVDLLTGTIVADLPGIELTSSLAVTIGQYESASVSLHVDATTDPDWLEATQPGGSALIAWTGDAAAPIIVWGGIVMQRVRTLSNDVQLALVTPESYLDACFVGDYTAVNLSEYSIVTALMAFAMGTGYLPWQLTNVTALMPPGGQSVAYASSAQVSVYSAMQSLSAGSSTIEWSAGWVWDVPGGTIKPNLNYGRRIGTAATPGLSPAVTFEAADLLAGSAVAEDYSPGLGANVVTCYGTASSTSTSSDVPAATATASNLNGRPKYAYLFQPSQTVSDATILGGFASVAVVAMSEGAQTISMSVRNDLPAKVFGVDWNLGDDIGWSLTGPAFPQPVSGVARCIGYQADATTVTPVLKAVAA